MQLSDGTEFKGEIDPSAALPTELVREALTIAATRSFRADPRKKEAWRRWLILSESYEGLIYGRIDVAFSDPDTKEELAKWISVAFNLALDVADEICVVWDKPATRSVGKPPEPPKPPPGQAPDPITGAKPFPPSGGLPSSGDKKPAAPADGDDEPAAGREPDPETGERPAGPPSLNGLPAPGVAPEPPAPEPPKAKDNPQTVALRKLYDELEFDSWAQDLNKAAWLLGEAVVVPSVHVPKKGDGRMRTTLLLPFFYDVIENPDDPQGEPLAYVYTLRRDDHKSYTTPIPQSQDRNGDVVVLDAQSWRIYKQGNTDPSKPDETHEHGLGYVPAVPLRFSRPLNNERWGDYRKHRRLVDATLSVGVIATQLEFVRKAQNKFLLLAIGDLPDGDDGETNDPERGRAIPTRTPGSVNVSALPFNTSPDEFVKHISIYYSRLAASYGGQALDTAGLGGTTAPRIEFSFAAQTEIRVDQITYARKFEKRLAEVVCDMAKAAKHPLADELPDAEEVRETFSVRFAPLSRVYANPNDEIAHFDFLKANGVVSAYDLARREDPDMTTEQCRDHVMARLQETSEVNSFAAARNMPMGAGGEGIESVPEALGKFGPPARDGAKQPPADAGKDEK